MPILSTPLERLPEDEQRELNQLEQEDQEDANPLVLLEGYGVSDLQAWLGSPFFVVFLEYLKEMKEEYGRLLIEGTVNTVQPSVPGFIFRSDEALRGAIALIGEVESCEDTLAEFVIEANEIYRDRLQKGE